MQVNTPASRDLSIEAELRSRRITGRLSWWSPVCSKIRLPAVKSSTASSAGCCSRRYCDQGGRRVLPRRRLPEQQVVAGVKELPLLRFRVRRSFLPSRRKRGLNPDCFEVLLDFALWPLHQQFNLI